MLIAESDVFWKSPSVYDVVGLVGLFLGIGSIWLALYLATKHSSTKTMNPFIIACSVR